MSSTSIPRLPLPREETATKPQALGAVPSPLRERVRVRVNAWMNRERWDGPRLSLTPALSRWERGESSLVTAEEI